MEKKEVQVRILTLNHEGGTKAYHFVNILVDCGVSFLITRWGKIGAVGQSEVKEYTNAYQAEIAHKTKRREKQGRGYEIKAFEKSITCNSYVELKAALNVAGINYEQYLHTAQLHRLVCAIEGVALEDGPSVDPAREITAKEADHLFGRKPKEPDSNESNPLWGMF